MVVADNRPVIEDGLSLALHCMGSRGPVGEACSGGEGIFPAFGKPPNGNQPQTEFFDSLFADPMDRQIRRNDSTDR